MLFSLIRRLLLVSIVVALAFGPANALQLAGWASMLAVRSVTGGVAAAVQSTFGGAEPCDLCTAAASLRDRESPGPGRDLPGMTKLSKKAEAPADPAPAVACLAGALGALPVAPRLVVGGASWRPSPVPPPPRAG